MKQSPPIKTPCGRIRSLGGKPYTSDSLRQHVENCHKCNGVHRKELEDAGLDPDVYDLIGDDESDGVFWAMYEEMGGTY